MTVINIRDMGFDYISVDVERSSIKETILKPKVPFKRKTIFSNFSHSFEQNKIVGLIGPNGSGKTSLLKLISGILTPDRGRIELNGSVAPIISLGASFHNDLTAFDNIKFWMLTSGFIDQYREGIEDDILREAGLIDEAGNMLRTFSSGMISRLAFFTAMSVKADIMLLDEVFAVGDTEFVEKSRQRIKERFRHSKLVLIVSHDRSLLEDVCDDVLLISKNGLLTA